MASSKRFFGNKRARSTIVALPPMLSWVVEDVPRWANANVEPELVRARLADRYRDARIGFIAPEAFDGLCAGLDPEAWRRLALAVSVLDFEAIRANLAGLLTGPAVVQVREAFVGFARSTPLLTLELLRQSPLRVEEFLRRWLTGMGATIADETPEQSRERLERLDYGRVLSEAEQAQGAAEARMEKLRKLQAEQLARRVRRGKF